MTSMGKQLIILQIYRLTFFLPTFYAILIWKCTWSLFSQIFKYVARIVFVFAVCYIYEPEVAMLRAMTINLLF